MLLIMLSTLSPDLINLWTIIEDKHGPREFTRGINIITIRCTLCNEKKSPDY
jgi:hypothetical protein